MLNLFIIEEIFHVGEVIAEITITSLSDIIVMQVQVMVRNWYDLVTISTTKNQELATELILFNEYHHKILLTMKILATG